MSDDEHAIRQVVDRWLEATRLGDRDGLLDLMTDDVVFLVPGQEPFGKQEFAQASERMRGARVEGSSQIGEIRILGEWAFIRNHLEIEVRYPDEGESRRLSGHTLTLLRKEADGRWRVARDANMVT